MENVKLLESKQTLQKIKRIAYEVFENNFEEKEIILAGIAEEGYELAFLIAENLKEISGIKISLAKLVLDKLSVNQPEIKVESDVDTFKDKTIILVDDVLNTGKTLAYCFRPFLSISIKRLQVAVLVDRSHPKYPIAADYVGYSLSTTISEHVKVVLKDKEELGVYLF